MFIVGGAEFTVGGAEFTVGRAEFTVGGAEFTVGGAEFTVGGAKFTVRGQEYLNRTVGHPTWYWVRFFGGHSYFLGVSNDLSEIKSVPKIDRAVSHLRFVYVCIGFLERVQL